MSQLAGCALLVLCIVAFNACSTQRLLTEGQHPQRFTKEVVRTVETRYLLYLPQNFSERGKQWPLLIFQHGSGERGADIEKVKVHGPPKIAEQKDDFPFMLVSPQCPENQRWSVETLNLLLDEVMSNLPIDEDRVYLTGLSMGGFGTWNLALQHPDRFAAIAPICGGGSFDGIRQLKDMPIWVFHGAKDDVVPLNESQRMVDELRRIGNDKVKFTVYPDANHDSWTETYANPELYKWFLEQRRKEQ